MADKKYNGRRQEIYFPSAQDLERWKKQSDKYNVPLSKWIYQTIEDHIDFELDPKKISSHHEDKLKLQTELNGLKDELKDKSARLEKAETDLFNLRHQAFLDPNPAYAKFSKDLIDLIKSGGTWSGRQILKALRIDPSNVNTIRIITNQLSILSEFSIIQETPQGWRWIND